MDRETARRTIADAGTALTGAGRSAPDADVPTCPGWTVSTVMKHVGLVHGWAAGMMRAYAPDRLPFPKAPDMAPGELADWADAQRATLLDALAASDGEREMWAFGQSRPAWFWWRRQALETAVHSWDATNAAGAAWEIPSDVGAEGIDELGDWVLARVFSGSPPTWGEGRTVHLHRTDGDGEWLVTIGDPPKMEHGHAKGDLAVRAPAAQLLRWAWNRPADVELFGDSALAEAWAANVQF